MVCALYREACALASASKRPERTAASVLLRPPTQTGRHLRNGDQQEQHTAAHLKSDKGNWSFFRAWLRVIYCAALPLFPCITETHQFQGPLTVKVSRELHKVQHTFLSFFPIFTTTFCFCLCFCCVWSAANEPELKAVGGRSMLPRAPSALQTRNIAVSQHELLP